LIHKTSYTADSNPFILDFSNALLKQNNLQYRTIHSQSKKTEALLSPAQNHLHQIIED